MFELADWRGTPIKVGCRIVYPGTSGSYLWITEAEVADVIEQEGQRSLRVRRLRTNSGSDDGTSTLTRLDRVTVVPHV